MYRRVLASYENSPEDTINKVKNAFNQSGKPVFNYSDISDNIKYEDNVNKNRLRPDVHCGQRKLFMGELRFLNEETDGTGLVIYAGGCPGNHLYELSIYYPDIRFLIIDPSGFQPYISENLRFEATRYKRDTDITNNPKIREITEDINQIQELWQSSVRLYWIRGLCYTELINKILSLIEAFQVDYYLWSDIRTGEGVSGIFGANNNNEVKQVILDTDIYQNLAMQYVWIRDTKPKSSMVKFRAPFYDNGYIDPSAIENEDIRNAPELCMLEGYANHEFKYPDGQIYLQPWTGKSSTEARMIIKPGTQLTTFNAYEYDNKFNYYNLIERPIRKHNVGIYNYNFKYCECNDCAIELDTLKKYLRNNETYIRERFKINSNVFNKKIVCKLGFRLSIILGKDILDSNTHGMNRY